VNQNSGGIDDALQGSIKGRFQLLRNLLSQAGDFILEPILVFWITPLQAAPKVCDFAMNLPFDNFSAI
jgi:hypothetical protein